MEIARFFSKICGQFFSQKKLFREHLQSFFPLKFPLSIQNTVIVCVFLEIAVILCMILRYFPVIKSHPSFEAIADSRSTLIESE